MSALLLTSLLAVATPLPAAAQEVHAFNVVAADPASAIHAFGVQAGIQILASADDLRGKKLNPVSGKISTEQALNNLLAGTGLAHSYEADPAVALVADSTANGAEQNQARQAGMDKPPADAVDTKNTRSDKFRLAEATAEQTKGNVSVDEKQKETEKNTSFEEIVVTGSRIPTPVGQQVVAVRTYSREDIENSGQSTIADFISTVPSVSVSSLDGPLAGQYADQTTVQLHGLPVGTTLVLLNGHRVEINNYGFFDLNNVPISAIERVEVLPVGASAIYGADALAGAVNIILRRDVDGFEATARYGSASATDETDAVISAGKKWDRGGISFIGSYQHRQGLLGSQRTVTANPEFNTAAVYGLGDICSPGTVYSLTGANLPGLQSTQAAIPRGITGKPNIQSFVATSGLVNQCGYYADGDILAPSDREGLMAFAHYVLSEHAEVYAELLMSHEQVTSQVGDLIQAINAFGYTVSAANPYNPFGQDVGISFTYPGLPHTYKRDTTFSRPLVGIRGNLSNDWTYDVTAFSSYDRSEVVQTDPNFSAIFAALASSDPATALNPFATGAPGPLGLLASLSTSSKLRFNSENITGEGLLRGTLIALPSGPLSAAFGVEYDHSKIYTYATETSISSPATTLSRNAYSLFTEERVPLIGKKYNSADGERLSLSIAGRYDDTSDYGHKLTGQAGVLWRATDSLLVRGGYATSYEAPQLPQLSGAPASYSAAGLVDPFRGNEALNNVPVVSGPNPNLKPETGRSRSVGILYSHKEDPNIEMSLTLWAIDIKDYISTPALQDLITYAPLFPGAVTRAPPSPQDTSNGFLGSITGINDLYFNFGDLSVNGVDLDVHYTTATRFGHLTPSVAITETNKYDSALSPSLPKVSNVSQANPDGFAPRWKGTVALAWEQDPLTVSLSGRYIGHYNDYLGNPFSYPHDIGNFWFLDGSLRYALGHNFAKERKWSEGISIQVGGVNLLNTKPRSSYNFLGYDYLQADIRGRFLYAQISDKW